MDATSDLELLLTAADLADRESMRTWRSDDLAVEIKPDGSPVSATDASIERLLRELLAEHRPGDRILGEEEGGEDQDTAATPDGRRWVIDPIDGTENYVAGRRAWSTLLALEVDGRPVAGVVSMPAVGRRWWGTLDDGAFRVELGDGTTTPIAVRAAATSGDFRWTSGPVVEQLDEVERSQLGDLVGRGTYVSEREWTTYPALMVASGELDAAVQFGHHWDHAAHSAVVVAAGGSIRAAEPPAPGARFAVTSAAHP